MVFSNGDVLRDCFDERIATSQNKIERQDSFTVILRCRQSQLTGHRKRRITFF